MAKRTCSIDGCEKEHAARGWCGTHWMRWKRHGDPLFSTRELPKPSCSVSDCDAEAISLGWCSLHLQRWKRHGDPLVSGRRPPRPRGVICEVDGCGKPQKSLGLCAMHYMRLSQYGSLDLPVREPRPKDLCSIEACEEQAECRDLCNKHYIRWRNHGDPMICLVSKIVFTCWHPGCERRRAKAGVCWTHHRYYKAKFLKEQGGRCAICRIRQEDAPCGGRLFLDHDHATGKPRAVLCHNCNAGLGHFKDNPVVMGTAIRYLMQHGVPAVPAPPTSGQQELPGLIA